MLISNNYYLDFDLSKGVVGYPYRTGQLVGQFMEIDTREFDDFNEGELSALREKLSSAAKMRDDNHVCYQIVDGPALMFHDWNIYIGMSVKKENW